jgi:TolA-binding protein
MGNYPEAIASYDKVLVNYPRSYKLAAALLKKAEAELQLNEKATATRNFREVVRRFPGTDEARRSQAKLKELGVSAAPRSAGSPH